MPLLIKSARVIDPNSPYHNKTVSIFIEDGIIKEVRSQKPEVRSQKPEARSQKPEVRSQKPEEKYIVRIKNSVGQEITQRVIPSGARNLIIDTSKFQKGIYLIEVCTSPFPSGRAGDGLCHTEKVVVE